MLAAQAKESGPQRNFWGLVAGRCQFVAHVVWFGQYATIVLTGGEEGRRRRTYNGDVLDAEHERVGRQIPGIRECVFFPELREEVLGRCHGGMVEDEVAYVPDRNKLPSRQSAIKSMIPIIPSKKQCNEPPGFCMVELAICNLIQIDRRT